MTNKTIKFEAGKSYKATSICDHNCVWIVKVIKRTAKFLTISVDGKTKRVGISIWNGEEKCHFSGRYSMAPVISAGKLA